MYNQKTKLNNKIVKFRKWRVKNRTKFNLKSDKTSIRDALVYDCVEDKALVFSDDEFSYLLMMIREASCSEKITYNIKCKCGNEIKYEANLSTIMKTKGSELGCIESNGNLLVMTELKNRKFYDEKMASCTHQEQILVDFILHIKTHNNNALSFDELLDVINNLEVEVFDDIMKCWNEMKFSFTKNADVACEKCDSVETFEFDDLPKFFPDSWNS